jgi:hypothetical protein
MVRGPEEPEERQRLSLPIGPEERQRPLYPQCDASVQ